MGTLGRKNIKTLEIRGAERGTREDMEKPK